jgi:hypothetical protein
MPTGRDRGTVADRLVQKDVLSEQEQRRPAERQ